MRLLNQSKDTAQEDILILLTFDEAYELKSDLETLLQKKRMGEHIHINDIEYKHEITLALYEIEKTKKEFQARINKLIIEDF